MTCNEILKIEGKPYPRTCAEHGLGKCLNPAVPTTMDLNHMSYPVLPNGAMPFFRNKHGAWMIYGYGDTLEVPYITNSLEGVVIALTRDFSNMYHQIGFWPHGMSMREAVDWWVNEAGRDFKAEFEQAVGS